MDDGLDERLRPLRVVFDRVDINRSGHIDWAELVEGVRAVQAFAELLGLPRKQHRHLCNAHETASDGHGGGNATQLAIEDGRDSGGSAGAKLMASFEANLRMHGLDPSTFTVDWSGFLQWCKWAAARRLGGRNGGGGVAGR